MTSVYSPPTAAQVGNFFVGQYYQVLFKNPDYVHQFYTDSSNMRLIDGSMIESASATLQIHSLIMSLNFKTIEIKTAQSMESWNGGVLVVVSGYVQTKEINSRRRFVQTFFLAPQEKGYFILNDIFQFIDVEHVEEHLTIAEHEHYTSELNTLNPLPEPVTDYVLGEEIESDEFVSEVHAEEIEVVDKYSEAVDKYSIPEPQPPVLEPQPEEDIQVEEPTVSYQSSMNISRDSPAVVMEEPIQEHIPVKHTYASILLTAKAQSRPFVPPPTLAKTIPVSSGWDEILPATVQSYPVQPVVPEKPNMEAVEYPSLDDEGEVTSVYVRNLPSSASIPELELEFKNFGKIKPDGVLIKSKKDVGVYYAFVEFEDINGVHNALKASPILFNGRQIHVEERRPSAISFRGRKGRGRGGYQPESTRGRFGGRSFSRGNGYVQRGASQQERGILGSQGPRNDQQFSDFAS